MPHTLLLISGSLRAESINTSALRTVADLRPPGWQCDLYSGIAQLPHFDPTIEAQQLPEPVTELRQRIDEASAVLICTPEYAGDLPGSFKNLLDWTVGGMETVGKPMAWINVSANSSQAAGAHQALEVVLNYTGATIITRACRHVPVARADVDEHGLITNPNFRTEARAAVEALTTL